MFRTIVQTQRMLQTVDLRLKDSLFVPSSMSPCLGNVKDISLWLSGDKAQAATVSENTTALFAHTPRLTKLLVGYDTTQHEAQTSIRSVVDNRLLESPHLSHGLSQLCVTRLCFSGITLGDHCQRIFDSIDVAKLGTVQLPDCHELQPLPRSLANSLAKTSSALR